MKSLRLIAAFAVALLASGCNSTSDEDSESTVSPDKLQFLSVVTTGKLVEGDTIHVTAVLQYELVSKDSGEINLGFNNWINADEDGLVDSATRLVAKGKGIDTIRLSGVVKTWEGKSNFHVYANLSPYPHTMFWIPLANVEYVLIPKK